MYPRSTSIHQLDARSIAHVQAIESIHDPALHGQLEQAYPGALHGRAGDDPVELLPGSMLEKEGCGGFLHAPLDLGGFVFCLRAVSRQVVQ
jgi:hypothetical protein